MSSSDEQFSQPYLLPPPNLSKKPNKPPQLNSSSDSCEGGSIDVVGQEQCTKTTVKEFSSVDDSRGDLSRRGIQHRKISLGGKEVEDPLSLQRSQKRTRKQQKGSSQ